MLEFATLPRLYQTLSALQDYHFHLLLTNSPTWIVLHLTITPKDDLIYTLPKLPRWITGDLAKTPPSLKTDLSNTMKA